METFDLSRLTDFDFEAVCKDIFEAEFGVRLEIFATGADAGVDLRHFTSGGTSLIVQCKHWHRSTRAKLIDYVEKTEAPKVARLNPQRYVLATSLTLTKNAKDRLFAALSPYVLSPNDIYGKDELDALLRKHEFIVRRHLRLWLTSASVLKTLLAKNILTRSEALIRDLDQTLLIYAVNPSFERALELLEATHVSVIAGMPGIGKTTLGNVLCAHYLSLGYELVELTEDADEANRMWDDSVKQVYYYDDFLGQTTLAEKLGKNEDGRLLSLMRRVSRSPNKRLVLTTREYILEQAKQRYERLDRHSFNVQTCVVDLADYTFKNRAAILYNHVYASALPADVKALFISPSIYLPIIEHRNFSPRIVSMTLAEAELLSDNPEQVPYEILANLNDPHRLWDHIVSNQLSDTDVKLLKVIFCFLSDIALTDLQELWVGYGESLRDLRKSLRVLEGTMLKSVEHRGRIYVGFHNPSIRDYLIHLLGTDVSEFRALVGLVKRFDQLEAIWLLFPGAVDGPVQQIFKRCREELEGAATVAFRTKTVDLKGSSGSWVNFARQAWVYLEMGAAIQSPAIREMGLEAVSQEKLECTAVGLQDFLPLLDILSQDDTPEGHQAMSDAVTSAIQWALADLSDWRLFESAAEVLEIVQQHAPGVEIEEALDEFTKERDDYAQSAFRDWSQTDHEPIGSVEEMAEIIEYYNGIEDAPYFEGFDTAEERIGGFDFEHLSAFSRSKTETPGRVGWVEAKEIANMMRTLKPE
ncbi:restriction endonuclease [Streptomyces pseudovenezuelae]|uniref:nSTAND3 domain-containing NTPase n=1 Tax=Streptomyces pseudovenezuelae TaxID=67350 RepID=UPI002E2FBAAD|nr:restriction endonuclease [Streptomyces pseudovenezuelae]